MRYSSSKVLLFQFFAANYFFISQWLLITNVAKQNLCIRQRLGRTKRMMYNGILSCWRKIQKPINYYEASCCYWLLFRGQDHLSLAPSNNLQMDNTRREAVSTRWRMSEIRFLTEENVTTPKVRMGFRTINYQEWRITNTCFIKNQL